MGQAWRAAAGMLAPQIEAEAGGPAARARPRRRASCTRRSPAELRETTGIDIGLWREGIAQVAATEAEAAELRARCAWQRQHGHLERLARRRRSEGALALARPDRAARSGPPREGALEPEKLVDALCSPTRERLGAALVQDTVIGTRAARRPRHRRGRPAAAATRPRTWCSRPAPGRPRSTAFPGRSPWRPVRGQMAALPWPRRARRAIIYGHGCYLVARGDEAIVGSTMEFAGYRAEVTSRRTGAGVQRRRPRSGPASIGPR